MQDFKDKSSSSYKNEIGKILKHLISTSSINMLDLSTKLGCSYRTIYDLADGNANPTIDTLFKVANYFNLNIAQLIGESPLQNYSFTFVKLVTLLELSEVEEFLHNTNSKLYSKNILVSSEKLLSEYTFAVYANSEAEPAFKTGTVLVFEKITSDIKNYNNKFVLTKNDPGILSIKKIFIEGNNIFLQPINVDIPPQPMLLNNTEFLAYLFQANLEFKN